MLSNPYKKLSSKNIAIITNGIRADNVTIIKFTNKCFSFASCPPESNILGLSFNKFLRLGTKEEKEILKTTSKVSNTGIKIFTKGKTKSKLFEI